jgi:hypothetical protein
VALKLACSFDESGSTVFDMSGNGNNFNLTTDATRVVGHTNGGIQPATTATVPLPNVGQTDERTVCMWIKGAVPDGYAIQWYDPTANSGAGSGAFGILFNMGNICIQARNAADVFTRAEVPWPDTTTWHHVAGTYGGGAVKLYLDGVLADQQSLVGPLRISNAPTLFGGWASLGSFDDLRVYDIALGASSVVAARDTPVASSDLASAANLSVATAFLARVTAAMMQYGVTIAKAILAAGSPSSEDKARLILSQAALTDPASYGQQFAWALGSDLAVDATVDDDTIRQMVQASWNVIAKVPI